MRKIGCTLGLLAVTATSVWAQPGSKPDKDGVYVVFGDVKSPTISSAAAATVPADLAGIRHISALAMVIGVDGIPANIEVMNRERSPLDDAAIAAVKQSQFQPGTLAGKPVPVRIFVWVPFARGDDPAIPETGPLNKVKNMTAPRPLNKVAAKFSDEARRNHFSGGALLTVVVAEDGMPTDLRVVVPLGMGLDEEALKAVRQYRFKPATLEGVPVPDQIVVEVNFQLYH